MQLIRWWGSWIHLHNLNWIVGLEQAERERERERATAVVVAQLAEQLFLTPEVPGSNPVIGNLYVKPLHTVICWKDVSKEKKKPRLTHFWAKKRPLKGKSRMWERKDMAEIESDTYLGNNNDDKNVLNEGRKYEEIRCVRQSCKIIKHMGGVHRYLSRMLLWLWLQMVL